MNFMLGATWDDRNYDKLNNISHQFLNYGMKMTPTKDKKLKLIAHDMASCGS